MTRWRALELCKVWSSSWFNPSMDVRVWGSRVWITCLYHVPGSRARETSAWSVFFLHCSKFFGMLGGAGPSKRARELRFSAHQTTDWLQ